MADGDAEGRNSTVMLLSWSWPSLHPQRFSNFISEIRDGRGSFGTEQRSLKLASPP